MEEFSTNQSTGQNLQWKKSWLESESGFQLVVEFFQQEVVHMIRKRKIPSSDYEDAVQEALICLMDCFERKDSIEDFLHYTRKSLKHILDRFSKERRQEVIMANFPYLDELDCDEPMMMAKEDHHSANQKEVNELISKLPKDSKSLVEEYFGLNGQEEKSIIQLAALRRQHPSKVKRELVQSLTYLMEKSL